MKKVIIALVLTINGIIYATNIEESKRKIEFLIAMPTHEYKKREMSCTASCAWLSIMNKHHAINDGKTIEGRKLACIMKDHAFNILEMQCYEASLQQTKNYVGDDKTQTNLFRDLFLKCVLANINPNEKTD